MVLIKGKVKLYFYREVGTIIKDKFDGATEVAIIEEDNKPTIVRKNVQFKRHTKADLVCTCLAFKSETAMRNVRVNPTKTCTNPIEHFEKFSLNKSSIISSP